MRGNLVKRGENVWRMRVYIGRRPDGKKLYASRTFQGGKRAAENALRLFIADLGLAPDSINLHPGNPSDIYSNEIRTMEVDCLDYLPCLEALWATAIHWQDRHYRTRSA